MPAPAVPGFVDPVSAVPPGVVPPEVVPPGVVSVGVVSVGVVLGPPEDAGLDVGEAGVEELLPGVGEDLVALGLAVPDGLAEDVEHCVSVALADVPLAFVFAAGAEVAVLVAVEVALAVPVAVVVAVPVAVPVVVVSAGLLVALPLGGLLTEFSGVALGAADLAGATVAELEGDVFAHPVTSAPP